MFTDKTDFNNTLDKAATVWDFFLENSHRRHTKVVIAVKFTIHFLNYLEIKLNLSKR